MTTFNPENKELLSDREAIEPAMNIVDPDDAAQYKAAYMAYIETYLVGGVNERGQTAEELANHNLGYFAGYHSDTVRARVEELFDCAHPIFGKIKERGSPTAAEAFHLGMAEGIKYKKQ
jgi:hypothetical protein